MPEHPEKQASAAQDTVDLMVSKAREFIHAQKNADLILSATQVDPSGRSAGELAAQILEPIAQAASERGVEITPEMALTAAAAIIQDIIELSQAATGNVLEGPALEEVQKTALDAFLQVVTSGGAAPAAPQGAVPPVQTGAPSAAIPQGAV